MPETPFVSARDAGGIRTLLLDRPASRNALSSAMLRALSEELARVRDDPGVRVVVLAGAGPSFCAGHDLKELLKRRRDTAFVAALFADCARMMIAIAQLPQPVIARVHGVATAAGCQLVASCDLAVAAEDARFATPGVNIGLFCSTPMVALARNVGRKAAMHMLLTGDMIDADTAVEIGLVNARVPAAQLDSRVAALAGQLAAKSPRALAIGKAAFHRQIELPLAEAYAHASQVMVQNLAEPDAAEGIAAFIGKRPPVWPRP